MAMYVVFVSVAFALCLHVGDSIHVTIGAIMPDDDSKLFSIRRVSPAIDYAIEILHNTTTHTYTVLYRDSQCNAALGMAMAIDLYIKEKIDVFFGPVCDYTLAPVARQVQYWNIPLLSVGAMAREFLVQRQIEYTTLSRLGPINFNSLADYLINLYRSIGWSIFKLIYQNNGQDKDMEGVCGIAAASLYHAFRDSAPEITLDYIKVELKLSEAEIRRILTAEIGNTYSVSWLALFCITLEALPLVRYVITQATRLIQTHGTID
ncbi:hypothetical protein DPMN_031153 [Dreissena polymorpha]|uniref:Receptor ligand binding region domain-containing protein n=1 Tax=Dreissena polymorpha TaxID=45954 RepID=A0A9D4M422_DREPO|nr:hypothetical protein DPMN_031153 [Dreissena polymorpha]